MELLKNYSLQVYVIASVAACSITVRGKVKLPDGGIVPVEQVVRAGAPYASNTVSIPLAIGDLISVVAKVADPQVRRGQVFVRICLNDGSGNMGATDQLLIQDYCTNSNFLAWPGGLVRQSPEGPGASVVVPVANPLAGLNFAYIVPVGARLKLKACTFTFTTSAVVLPRQVMLNITIGGVIVSVPFCNVFQAGGLAWQYFFCCAPSFVSIFPPNLQSELNGELVMPGASIVGSAITGLDVADQITNITLVFEHLIEV